MRRLSVLKLGDELYSESLQKMKPVYHRAFPQRETQLYSRLEAVDLVRLSHQRLLGGETRATINDQVSEVLRRQTFDLVLIDNPLSILALDHRVETPVVFDCIDWYDEMYATEFGDRAGVALLRSCFREAVQRSQAVIAQSPLMLQAVWSVQRPPRSLVLPNGYDEALFRPFGADEAAGARACIEERHGLRLCDRRLIVYTGKIGDWYSGLVNLIEGLDPLRDLLLLVGDGPMLSRLPRPANVVSCGVVPLEQVPQYTNAADILVFPLGADCSPIVVSEYLAVGKPIVAPRGRIEWLIRDGVGGVIVDDTPEGWRRGIDRAAALDDAATQPNLRLARRLGWSQLATRMERFLQVVAADRPSSEGR